MSHLDTKKETYALSVFGWGLAGAVAAKAAKLRWIPGQKSMRYDIAGFVTVLQVRHWCTQPIYLYRYISICIRWSAMLRAAVMSC